MKTKPAAGKVATSTKKISRGTDTKAARKSQPAAAAAEGKTDEEALCAAAEVLRQTAGVVLRHAAGAVEKKAWEGLLKSLQIIDRPRAAGGAPPVQAPLVREAMEAENYWRGVICGEPWFDAAAKLEVLLCLDNEGRVLQHVLLGKTEGDAAASSILPQTAAVCWPAIESGAAQCLLLCQRPRRGPFTFSRDEEAHFDELVKACAAAGVQLLDLIVMPMAADNETRPQSLRHRNRSRALQAAAPPRREYLHSPVRLSAVLLTEVACLQADGLPLELAWMLAGYCRLDPRRLPELVDSYARWMPLELQAALSRRYNYGPRLPAVDHVSPPGALPHP